MKILRALVTLAAIAVAVVAAVYGWRLYEYSPWTRDGRVRANVVAVAPDVSGSVVSLAVKDNQVVRKGDVLLVIDQSYYRLALQQAQANMQSAWENLQLAQSNQGRAERESTLAITAQQLQQTRTTAAVAAAAYAQAQAAVHTAELNLARTELKAPVDGPVTNLQVDVGTYASAGKPLIAMVDSSSFYVLGYFEETKLPAIRPGARASIRLMGYATPLEARVQGIAAAISDLDNVVGANLVANVNPTFTWVRLAERIPVRFTLDKVPDDLHLAAGLTATIVVEAGGGP